MALHSLIKAEATIDEEDLYSLIDGRIQIFANQIEERIANQVQPIDKDNIKKIMADLLRESHLQLLMNQSGEKAPSKPKIPIIPVVKLTEEQREARLTKLLDKMPNAVRDNYWNLIPEDDRPIKCNPLYEIGRKSGKIPFGAEFVTDIKQYALMVGFAPSDLQGSRLPLYYGRLVHGRWDENTSLLSLKNCCGEYSKRFKRIYGEDTKPTPEEIFGIE